MPSRRVDGVRRRDLRCELAGGAGQLGSWAVYVWIDGQQAGYGSAGVTGCQPASFPACADMLSNFNFAYGDKALAASVMLQTVPALIGAFAGAPVLARELETGTVRYTWTLGLGRWRWALAKLVPLAVT